jgi:glycosyltransferase involved in cell wall biosynthesis
MQSQGRRVRSPNLAMPVVSVIIPTFNNARFLSESIPSVLQQSFSDFELLVIDDGSTDDTRNVISQFEGDPRFHSVCHENRGGAAARNTGILRSYAPFVAFLDADDVWLPDKLQKQVAFLQENPEISAVHTAMDVVRIDSEHRELSRHTQRRPALRERTLYEELLYQMVITGSASSVMVRRTTLDEVGLFDESVRISDRDMWQRLSLRHSFGYIDEPLVCIRKHSTNMSSKRSMMVESQVHYFQKLSRDIPPEYRFHLPRVAIDRFSRWTLVLLRYGELREACTTAWIVLSHAFRSPGSVFHVAFRLACLSGQKTAN